VQIALDDGTLLNVRILETELGANLELAWKTVLEESSSYTVTAVPGVGLNYLPQVDPVSSEARLFLLDVPLIRDSDHAGRAATGHYWAAGAYFDPPWRAAVLFASDDGAVYLAADETLDAVGWGIARTALPDTGLPFQTDLTSQLQITMVSGSLASVSSLEMLNGANLAALIRADGNAELIQFQDVALSERLCCRSRVDVMGKSSLGPRSAARLALADHRLRRLAALPHPSAQALTLRSHRQSAVRPAAAIADHGVQDHQEFAHAGGERELRGAAGLGEALVEGPHRRVETNRGERGHEQGLAHAAAAAGDHAAAPEGAAVAVDWRDRDQGRDGASVLARRPSARAKSRICRGLTMASGSLAPVSAAATVISKPPVASRTTKAGAA
jgi:hypothetical protein